MLTADLRRDATITPSAEPKRTILVVDDSDTVRGVTCEIIRSAGYEVVEASSGSEAMQAAAEGPDLIILDIDLPDVDGFEVCRRIKASPGTAPIPVLHLSGQFLDVADRVRGLETGADGYLTRPVESTELLATIKALLRLRWVEQDLERSESRRRAAEALAAVGRLLVQSLDPEVVGQRIVDSVRVLLGAQSSALYRLERTEDLVAIAACGDAKALFEPKWVFPQGTGMVGVAVRERRPVSTLDFLTDPRVALPPELRARLELAPYRAVLAAPLLVQGRVIGALGVGDGSGRVFTAEEIQLAEAFADQAAIALENARLYQESKRQRRRLATLVQVGQRLARGLDLDSVLRSIAEAAAAVFGGEAGFRLLEGDELVRVGATPGARQIMVRERLRLGESLSGRAAVTGEPMIAADSAADPRLVPEHRAAIRPDRAGALLCVPIRLETRILGTLHIFRERGYRFDQEALELARSLADQAAIAIGNAQLYAETTDRLKETAALLAVGQVLACDLPIEESVRRVAREVGRALGADMVGAYFLDEPKEALVPLAGYHVPTDLRSAFRATPFPLARFAFLREAWRTRKPVWTGDAISDARFDQTLIEVLQPRAVLFAPTLVRDDIVGGLFLVWNSPGRAPTPAELRLVGGVATQVGLALERKRAEAALRESEEQLRHAQKMEAVGRLAGGVAHDFNNLLTVILGRSQLLLSRLEPDEPLRRDVDLIQKTADRAAALTQRLLAFSRKQMLQPKVLSLDTIVVGMGKIVRRLIGEDIELVVLPGPAQGRVEADPAQLEQVILNLAVNARDAMPHGGRLTFQTADVDLDAAFVGSHPGAGLGPHVMLAVTDTGVGMDATIQAHLFEPFFTTKGPGKGTGLGLATVYGIVKQHRGYIAVKSEPGGGAAFRIYLPRAEGTGESTRSTAARGGARQGSETILLVEDEDGLRELAREILETQGYTVLEASDGIRALDTAAGHGAAIHLLLTDVVMPQMSGRELADRLTSLRPEVQVLYMSGYTEDAIVQQSVLDPHAAFLNKPFSPDDLTRTVRNVLDRSVAHA